MVIVAVLIQSAGHIKSSLGGALGRENVRAGVSQCSRGGHLPRLHGPFGSFSRLQNNRFKGRLSRPAKRVAPREVPRPLVTRSAPETSADAPGRGNVLPEVSLNPKGVGTIIAGISTPPPTWPTVSVKKHPSGE